LAPAYSWYLALRYLLTRWVNVLGMAGVAVAVWALIVVIAVFSGFIEEFRSAMRGATADLLLTDVSRDTSYKQVRAVLEDDPDVESTSPRLVHYGILFPYGTRRQRTLLTGATGSRPLQLNFVTLLGVDPERERQTTEFGTWIESGPSDPSLRWQGDPPYRVEDLDRPLQISDRLHKLALRRAGQTVLDGPMLSTGPGILLSYRRMLIGERMEPGQLVDIVSADLRHRDGEEPWVMKMRMPCVLGGGYETQHRVFDEFNAIIHIDDLRRMLGHDDPFDSVDVVSEVAIRTKPGADLDAVKARLSSRTAELGGGAVQTWEDQNAVFLAAVEHERGMMKIVLFAVMLVAGFLIYATLHMMVTQKFKDIGILTSLGAAPRGVASIFLVCGCVIATIGCATGAALGLLSAYYLNDVNDWFGEHFDAKLFPTEVYNMPRIPYLLEAGWISQVLVAAFALSLLVAYLPARRAARMDPVKALSYE